MAELEPTTTDRGLPESTLESAFRWVADTVYPHLLETGEPTTGRELLPLIQSEAPVGPKTLKRALEQDPRFQRVERKWIVAPQDLDERRPIERSIVSLIEAAGQPLSPTAMGRQLALVYPREENALVEIIERMVKNRPDFFLLADDRVGISNWLLDASAGNLEDIEFENFEDASEVQELRTATGSVDWTTGTLHQKVIEFLDAAGKPVSNKALQLYLWQAYPKKFEKALMFRLLYENPELRLISPAAWAGPRFVEAMRASLTEFEGSDAEVELTNEDVPKPITVEAEDVDAVAEHLSELPVRSAELLSIQFPDLRADDPNYPTTSGS
ncbi:MAG: hypothetical protein KY468_18480, partial [Armatimonadetes bacterium]|nr:hypothetical protein [Armatimonadota bacterium]